MVREVWVEILATDARRYSKMSNNSSKRAPTTATQRLKQDYLRIKKDPVPYICAEPLPSNILEWHYVVRGPEMTPYEGGRPSLLLELCPDQAEKCSGLLPLLPGKSACLCLLLVFQFGCSRWF
ncbi:hypothetical protein CB1_000203015 [Camelus ferus]|nr:hypothetical protein CB1_000203015 [Camelus ferus]